MNVTPEQYDLTRESLHRVAVHIVARAREQAVGRFGLRVLPGGFGTPEFGDGPLRVRVGDGVLFVEDTGSGGARSRALPINGHSLADLAQVAGVSLDLPLSVGHDTPPLGDVDEPLTCDLAAMRAVADWWTLSARAIDQVVGHLPAEAQPTVAQLWPEHFDLGLDVGVGGIRLNLGGSPGDAFHAGPYLYVGPWTADRPGDATYWNVSFGALVGSDELGSGDDALDAAVTFFTRGVDMVSTLTAGS